MIRSKDHTRSVKYSETTNSLLASFAVRSPMSLVCNDCVSRPAVLPHRRPHSNLSARGIPPTSTALEDISWNQDTERATRITRSGLRARYATPTGADLDGQLRFKKELLSHNWICYHCTIRRSAWLEPLLSQGGLFEHWRCRHGILGIAWYPDVVVPWDDRS